MISRFELKRPSTASIMSQVMLALVPGTLLMMWWLGAGVWINVLVVVLISVLTEAAVLLLRQKPVSTTLADGSIVLAAWLLALCLPPTLPISHLVVGAVAMTLLGKHVYGGLGQNLFNPAMVGYAVLLISFPKSMTLWLDPNTMSQWPDVSSMFAWWQFKWHPESIAQSWDTITQATPLDRLRTLQRQSLPMDVTLVNQSPWWELNIAWLLGGLFLLVRGIIRWHIPVTVLLSVIVLHWVHGTFFAANALPTPQAVMYGGVIFAAFFIVTDPVTAPSSRQARLCYGLGIGAIAVWLRTTSNYPEGIAFAILLMNAAVPLLDRLFVLDRRQ